MMKQFLALAVVVALSACSSDSGSTPETTTGGGTTGGGTTGGGTTDSGATDGTVTPSGGLPGVWVGQNNYGEGVMVIDANQNVYSLAARNDGQREVVFGPASEQMQHFIHRDSDNPASASSFTLVGDLPSELDAAASDTITYNLTVENDGQQITNSATATAAAYTMNLADLNDVPAITVADVAGTWTANTSFCVTECDLALTMVIAANGAVTGNTNFNAGAFVSDIVGTAAAANGSSQFLTVSFAWNDTTRNGVMYRDRSDTTRLIVNTIGPDGDINRSFTASMTR